MYEWSQDDLAVRDAVRKFVDKELRPNQDALEFEGLPPYDLVRSYYSAFGLAEAAAQRFDHRSEEHTSELQSLMRISYAVFCLKKTKRLRQYNISQTKKQI